MQLQNLVYYQPGIDISDIVTFSIRNRNAITNKSSIEQIKWKSNLGIYTESDISALSGTIDTSLNVGTLLTSNTLQVNNSNLVVDSTNGVTTNLSLSVSGDISINSYLYVNDYIHNIGDVSLVNGRFTITQTDVSMSQNVFMGQDLSVNGNVDICGTLDVKTLQVSRLDNLEFVGINRTGKDFSFNIGTDFSVDKSGNTIIGGNVDISNGLDLSGNFTQQKGTITFTGTDNNKSLYIDSSANLDLSGIININNNNIQLTSNGSGYFVGDLSANSNLDIYGATNLFSILNVLNGLTRLLELSASTVEISGGSINNTTIGLTNPEDASFAYVTVSNDLVVLGRSDFNSDVSIISSSLTVDNDITFAATSGRTVTSAHLGVDSGGQVTTSKLLIKDNKLRTSPVNIADFNESLITLYQDVSFTNGNKIILGTVYDQTDAPIEIIDDTGNIIIKLHPNSGNYSEFKNDISLIGNVDLGISVNSDTINIGGPFTSDNLHVRATSTFYHNMILDTYGELYLMLIY